MRLIRRLRARMALLRQASDQMCAFIHPGQAHDEYHAEPGRPQDVPADGPAAS